MPSDPADKDVAPAVQEALSSVPQEEFLAPRGTPMHEAREAACVIPPTVIGEMVSCLELPVGAKVLHVGTGGGYAAAVLSRLAAAVFTLEHSEQVAKQAARRFVGRGYENVQVVVGEGESGYLAQAPYDGILVTAHLDEVPRPLLAQLADGARLAALSGPVGQEEIRVYRRLGDQFPLQDLEGRHVVKIIGDMLVADGVVSREQVERVARVAGLTDRRIGELLLDSGLVDERDLYRALAAQRGLEAGSFLELYPLLDLDVVKRAPRTFLDYNQLIPLAVEGDTLKVATSNPAASFGELLSVYEARAVEAYLVTPTDFRRFWSAVDIGMEEGSVPEVAMAPPVHGPVDLLKHDEELDAHLVALFEAVLLDAVGERASDIHFECYGERVRVRIRVDGELHDIDRYRLSRSELAGLVNIVKVRAHLDIAERRLPQGGRYAVRVGQQGLDLRVQTQPSLHGEHVVIRLLPQKTELMHVDQLGFPPWIAKRYQRLLQSPAGLVLVVGPTGSGKSTTLYAGLQELAAASTRKVITVEDPIEYSLANIQQCQVKPEIDFNFSSAMRVFVRQDPDVILVGEIRDSETALEAIRASQTGHLVLSTLHCNDSVDAVQRLLDLQMHPNSIASELLAVLAQRLAKRVCPECREPQDLPEELAAELFGDAGTPEDFVCFEGRGCARCRHRGTRGRVAVVELLHAGKAVRRAISHALPVDEIRQIALDESFSPMREQALELVRAGIIPVGELPRILPPERMASELRRTG